VKGQGKCTAGTTMLMPNVVFRPSATGGPGRTACRCRPASLRDARPGNSRRCSILGLFSYPVQEKSASRITLFGLQHEQVTLLLHVLPTQALGGVNSVPASVTSLDYFISVYVSFQEVLLYSCLDLILTKLGGKPFEPYS